MAQGPHGEKPLRAGLVKAHKDAKALAAGDHTPLHLADATLVELGHLDLLRVPSGGVGGALHGRAGLAELREHALDGPLLAAAVLAGQVRLERPVHHVVGIAPDGRREVTVGGRSQGVVALVVR